MKAYTNLEQSRILAEILPIDSADMKYPYFGDGQYGETALFGEPIEFSGGKDIPAWSLAALLEVLPLEVETHRQTDGHKIYYYVESYMRHMGREIYLSTEERYLSTVHHENLVDACYEMILKLYEKKLL